MMFMTILYLFFLADQIGSSASPTKEITFNALDCRKPRTAKFGAVSQLCPKITIPHNMEQSFHVLQAVDHKVVTATKCTRYQTRHTLYCGAFSHIKYLIPPTSHETVPVSVAQCEMMKSSGTYQDGKGRIHPIKDGQVLDLEVG